MKILLLINILLSAAIARCASSSSTFDGSTPRVVQVNIASGKAVEISVGPDTTLVDFKKQLREKFFPGSFNPTKLVCGVETVEDSKRLQEILNGTERPELTLIMGQPKAHSYEEMRELEGNLKNGEGFFGLISRAMRITDSEGNIDTIELRWVFCVYWKYVSKVNHLLYIKPFERKPYTMIAPRVDVQLCVDQKNSKDPNAWINIPVWVKFKITDWDFESEETRFKAQPDGIFLSGTLLPKPLPETIYSEICYQAITKMDGHPELSDADIKLEDFFVDKTGKMYLLLGPFLSRRTDLSLYI